MPRYDYKCEHCGITFEAVMPSEIDALPCMACLNQSHPNMLDGHDLSHVHIKHLAQRQLSVPACIHIH